MNTLTLKKENIYTGNLILVNQHYGVRHDPEDLLVPACDTIPEILLQRCAASLLGCLMKEIRGWRSIVPVSGWRSLKEQQQIWDDSLRENGAFFTQKYVAVPGHSEHQTGLAIDLGLRQENIDFICPDFPYSGICQTFREKAARYGFILRYPEGKEQVTGIGHEPWHFRYVGTPHAEIIVSNHLTLEEYMEFLRQYPYENRPYVAKTATQTFRISYINAVSGSSGVSDSSFVPVTIDISDKQPYTISGDNMQGFILTEWRKAN